MQTYFKEFLYIHSDFIILKNSCIVFHYKYFKKYLPIISSPQKLKALNFFLYFLLEEFKQNIDLTCDLYLFFELKKYSHISDLHFQCLLKSGS